MKNKVRTKKERVHKAIFAFSKQTFFFCFCCIDNFLVVVKPVRSKLESEFKKDIYSKNIQF